METFYDAIKIKGKDKTGLNNIIEKRLIKLRESVFHDKEDKSEYGIDTLMVLIEENRRYLSGFTGEDTQFDESAGALFINKDRFILATDSRFTEQAEKEAPMFEIVCYKEGLAKELPEILQKMGTKKLGFETIRMTYYQYKKISEQFDLKNLDIELIETENLVENFRVYKDITEMQKIRNAISVAESVFTDVTGRLEPGMTESKIAWDIEKGMREAGAESCSFATIVASGPNSAMPHAIPGNRKIKNGEPVLIDWGAKIDDYCSDTTRTIVLGEPEDRFKKVYMAVYDAQRMAIDAVKPGVSSKKIDSIARNHINKKGFEGKFGHGLGHGIGLAVHEPPRVGPLKDTIIEEGMVFTIEPGIYIPGWGGIRLENMVEVQKEGAEVLNNLGFYKF